MVPTVAHADPAPGQRSPVGQCERRRHARGHREQQRRAGTAVGHHRPRRSAPHRRSAGVDEIHQRHRLRSRRRPAGQRHHRHHRAALGHRRPASSGAGRRAVDRAG
nr:hypothetical protein [Gordonia mangrovi]